MRQQTLRMVSHVSHAHASQLLGLVVEYVVDARTGEPWLNAVLSTCWPESWSRRRRTNKHGGGMGAAVAGGLESMSSSGSIGLGGSLPSLSAVGSPGRGSPVSRPGTTAGAGPGPAPLSPPQRPNTSSATDRTHRNFGSDRQYGLNSTAAAVLAPRYSER